MLDRRLAPPFVKSTSFHLPDVTRHHLENGINIIHLKDIQQDVIKLDVVFPAGKWFETKPEIAHFTAQMLDKGTKTKTSAQIADFFDRYGAHIELTSNFDHATVSLYSLTKHFGELYPVFLELLTIPAFNSDELIQLKENFIQSL
ncbi:MAG: insulinase family protein, partial [Cyclobacteriaceae bacterium]|nr:insulinase family protein [Cyclobacteriaceae bacterium]